MKEKCVPLKGVIINSPLPNAVINLCPKRVIRAVTCRQLDPEHTLSSDIPLDF